MCIVGSGHGTGLRRFAQEQSGERPERIASRSAELSALEALALDSAANIDITDPGRSGFVQVGFSHPYRDPDAVLAVSPAIRKFLEASQSRYATAIQFGQSLGPTSGGRA
jgi:hypothetical protein